MFVVLDGAVCDEKIDLWRWHFPEKGDSLLFGHGDGGRRWGSGQMDSRYARMAEWDMKASAGGGGCFLDGNRVESGFVP